MAEKTQATATHVAILPSPGMGHLIPFLELAKRLVNHHNLSVTIIVPTTGPPTNAQKSVVESLPSGITSTFLPPADLSDIPADAKAEILIFLAVQRSLPSIRDVLKSLVATTHLAAFVVDPFSTDAFDVAREFNVSPYLFCPATTMSLSFLFYLPELDEKVTCEFWELQEPINIPGSVPIHGNKLLDPVQDRKSDVYKWLLHHAKRFTMADGIMVNSFLELEPRAIKSLQEDWTGKPPVYMVGPLVNIGSRNNSKAEEEAKCLRWLDEQPHGSVLYVSFGSGGTLSHDQIIELALGLEMSEQRFLWVLRSPNDKSVASAAYFNSQSQKDPFDFLPEGFLDRTKGRGLVVSSWAPQAQVLSHGSTGGFLTHCGWNSTLESVVNGVPLIAWPLYAEQKMNAVMLTEDIKIALTPAASENGLIERHEIAKIARELMEGEEGNVVRDKMRYLKEAAARVLSEDGSSTRALSELTVKWENKISN